MLIVRKNIICSLFLFFFTSSLFTHDFTHDNRAKFFIHLPPQAEVIVDGESLGVKGTYRYFCSTPISPGLEYYYTIIVKWKDDASGLQHRQTAKIYFYANDVIRLDFR